MATNRLREAIAQDQELSKAATFLADRFRQADLNGLVVALDQGDEERIALVMDTDVETLTRTFESLKRLADAYEADFPELREYREARARLQG